jgi:hypothetical protein
MQALVALLRLRWRVPVAGGDESGTMLCRQNENVMAAEQDKVLVRSLAGEAVNQPAQPITLFQPDPRQRPG